MAEPKGGGSESAPGAGTRPPLGYKKIYVEFWSWQYEVRQLSSADKTSPLSVNPFAPPNTGSEGKGAKVGTGKAPRAQSRQRDNSLGGCVPSPERGDHQLVNAHRQRSVSWNDPGRRRELLEAVLHKVEQKIKQRLQPPVGATDLNASNNAEGGGGEGKHRGSGSAHADVPQNQRATGLAAVDFVQLYPELQEEFKAQGLSLDPHRMEIMIAVLRNTVTPIQPRSANKKGTQQSRGYSELPLRSPNMSEKDVLHHFQAQMVSKFDSSIMDIRRTFEGVDLRHFFCLYNVVCQCATGQQSTPLQLFEKVLYMCRTTCPAGLDLLSAHSNDQWRVVLETFGLSDTGESRTRRKRLQRGIVYVNRYKQFCGLPGGSVQTAPLQATASRGGISAADPDAPSFFHEVKITENSFFKMMPLLTLNVPLRADLAFLKTGLRQISGRWTQKRNMRSRSATNNDAQRRSAGVGLRGAGSATSSSTGEDQRIIVIGDRFIVLDLDDGRFGIRRPLDFPSWKATTKPSSSHDRTGTTEGQPAEEPAGSAASMHHAPTPVLLPVVTPWNQKVDIYVHHAMSVLSVKSIIASKLRRGRLDLHDVVLRYPQTGKPLKNTDLFGTAMAQAQSLLAVSTERRDAGGAESQALNLFARVEFRGSAEQWRHTRQLLYPTLPPLRGPLWLINRVLTGWLGHVLSSHGIACGQRAVTKDGHLKEGLAVQWCPYISGSGIWNLNSENSSLPTMLSAADFDTKPWNVWMPATIVQIYWDKDEVPATRRHGGVVGEQRRARQRQRRHRKYFDVHCPSLTTPLVRRQVAESIRPIIRAGLNDIRYDLQDGVLLCRALECLSGTSIPPADFHMGKRHQGSASSSGAATKGVFSQAGYGHSDATMTHAANMIPTHPMRVTVFDPPENDDQRRFNLEQFLLHFEKTGEACNIIGKQRIIDDLLDPIEPLLQSKVDVALALLWALVLAFRVRGASIFRHIDGQVHDEGARLSSSDSVSSSESLEGVRGFQGLLHWCQSKLHGVEKVTTHGWEDTSRVTEATTSMANLHLYKFDGWASHGKEAKSMEGFRPPVDAAGATIAVPEAGGVLLRYISSRTSHEEWKRKTKLDQAQGNVWKTQWQPLRPPVSDPHLASVENLRTWLQSGSMIRPEWVRDRHLMTCESMSDLETLMRPQLRTVGMGHYWWLNLRLTDAEAESVVANDKQDERVQALRVQWERRALHRTHRRWLDQRGLLTVFPNHLDLTTASAKSERQSVAQWRSVIRKLFEASVSETHPGYSRAIAETLAVTVSADQDSRAVGLGTHWNLEHITARLMQWCHHYLIECNGKIAKAKTAKKSGDITALVALTEALRATKPTQQWWPSDWSPAFILTDQTRFLQRGKAGPRIGRQNPYAITSEPALVGGILLICPALFAIVANACVNLSAESWAVGGYCGAPVEAVPSSNRALALASLSGIPPLLDTNDADVSRTAQDINLDFASYFSQDRFTAVMVDKIVKDALGKYATVSNNFGGFGALVPAEGMPVWGRLGRDKATLRSIQEAATDGTDEVSSELADWMLVETARSEFDVGDGVRWSLGKAGAVEGTVVEIRGLRFDEKIEGIDASITLCLDIYTTNDQLARAYQRSIGSFDIVYGSSTKVSHPNVALQRIFQKGDRVIRAVVQPGGVLLEREAEGRMWQSIRSGKIKEKGKNNTYTVLYDDNVKETGVPARELRNRPSPALVPGAFKGIKIATSSAGADSKEPNPVCFQNDLGEWWVGQVQSPCTDAQALLSHGVSRSAYEDRRVSIPYLLLLLDEDVCTQRVRVAIEEFHSRYSEKHGILSKNQPRVQGHTSRHWGRHEAGCMLEHPTFSTGVGAAGGGAGGEHTGSINYVQHVVMSDGAIGGLLAVVRELTDLYLRFRALVPRAASKNDAAIYQPGDVGHRFLAFATEVLHQLGERDSNGLNAFQHMLQKGDSRMFNLFFSSDSVRVVASAGTREHLAGNAGEAAAAAAASAAAAQAVASATAAATHDRSRRGSTSTRQHRQPQSRSLAGAAAPTNDNDSTRPDADHWVPSALGVLLTAKSVLKVNSNDSIRNQRVPDLLQLLHIEALALLVDWLRPLGTGATFVHMAAARGNLQMMHYLLRKLRFSLLSNLPWHYLRRELEQYFLPAWSTATPRRHVHNASASDHQSAKILLGKLDLFTHADADTEVVRRMLRPRALNDHHQPYPVAEAFSGIRPLMLAMVHGHVESAQFLDLMIDFANAVDPNLGRESQHGSRRDPSAQQGTGGHAKTAWDWWRMSSRLCWVWGGLTSFHWAALMGHRRVLQIIFSDLKHHVVQWYTLQRKQPKPSALEQGGGSLLQDYFPTDRFLWWSLMSGAFADPTKDAAATTRASAIHCAAFSGRIHVCKFLLGRLQTLGCFEQRQSDFPVQEHVAIAPPVPSDIPPPQWCSTWPMWSSKHADDDASVIHIGGSCKSFLQRALEQTDVSGRTVVHWAARYNHPALVQYLHGEFKFQRLELFAPVTSTAAIKRESMSVDECFGTYVLEGYHGGFPIFARTNIKHRTGVHSTFPRFFLHASVDASCWELSVGFRPGDRVVLRTTRSFHALAGNVRDTHVGSPRRPPVGQRDLSSANAWATEGDAAEVLHQDAGADQLCLPSGLPRVLDLPRVKWCAHRLSVLYLNREFAAGKACAVPDQADWYEVGTRIQGPASWPRVGVRWCETDKRQSMRPDGDMRSPSHVAAISGSTGMCWGPVNTFTAVFSIDSMT
eukprot:INCI14694.2.p1 GENE.INCI14694.2~~INCI14694.2.p1  ORF type:complete len:2735 (+),score=323.04 INCI14694.2:86-8290(+)